MSSPVICSRAPSIFAVSVEIEPKAEKLQNITAVALFAIAGIAIASACPKLEDRIVWTIFIGAIALRLIWAIVFEEKLQLQSKPNDNHIKNTSDIWGPFIRRIQEQKPRSVEKEIHVCVGERPEEFKKFKLLIKNKETNSCATRSYDQGCKALDEDFHALIGKRIQQKPSLDANPHAAVGGGVQMGKEEHAHVGTR